MENLHDQSATVNEGIITFHRMQNAMLAEKFLKAASFSARIVVPPHLLDTGCNLGLIFDLSKLPEVERLLKDKRVEYTHIGPLGECQ